MKPTAETPAFPVTGKEYLSHSDHSAPVEGLFGGINVRTYIATQLMAGILANRGPAPLELCAAMAIEGADILITSLNK